jgi:hypothetical protein
MNEIEGGGVSSLPRHSVSLDNVKMRVEPTKKTSQACVLVGITVKLDAMVLLSLKQSTLFPFNSSDVDTTIVAYSAFQNVYKELFGNAQASAASKVSSVNCGYDRGEFLVSAVCDRTISSVRKVSGLIMKNLKFSAVNQTYRAYCNTLNIKPDPTGFAYAVNTLNKAVDNGVNIAVTGKININAKSKLEDAIVPIVNKLKDLQNKEGPKQRTVVNEKSLLEDYITVSLPSGLDRIVAKEYLDTHLMKTVVVNGEVILPVKFESMFSKLNDKEKMSRFADKLDRLGSDLAGVLSYTGSVDCSISTTSVSSNKELKKAELKAALAAMF